MIGTVEASAVASGLGRIVVVMVIVAMLIARAGVCIGAETDCRNVDVTMPDRLADMDDNAH